MAVLHEITDYLDEVLELNRFPADVSNNGLQFEGAPEVSKAVFAVDACEAVFQIATKANADFIFTHHGISWGGGNKYIRGHLARRITQLASARMSLYSAHLPLDANELFGHNALLSDMINLKDRIPFGEYRGCKIGFRGTLAKETTIETLVKKLDKALPSGSDIQVFGELKAKVRHPGIISGGGAFPELFSEIESTPVDCLITGAADHECFHPALETGTQIITLGHYRSETPGVIAVMNMIRNQFNIETEFIDVPTGL